MGGGLGFRREIVLEDLVYGVGEYDVNRCDRPGGIDQQPNGDHDQQEGRDAGEQNLDDRVRQ